MNGVTVWSAGDPCTSCGGTATFVNADLVPECHDCGAKDTELLP